MNALGMVFVFNLASLKGTVLVFTVIAAGALMAGAVDAVAAQPSAQSAQSAQSGQSASSGSDAHRAWELGVAIGYGQRSNPLVDSDTLRLYADLDIAWFGERWFFDNGDLGYSLHNGRLFTLNLLARVNSDRLFFTRTNGPVGLINSGVDGPLPPAVDPTMQMAEPPDRNWTLEGGVELLAEGRWGFLEAAVMHDTLGVHSGYEAAVGYGYGLVANRWYIEPSVRLMYKSSELNDYYWGLRADEAPPGVAAYRASAGLNWLARCSAAYRINERIAVSLAVEYEQLNGAVRGSPIVAEDEVLGFFVGLGYRF